MIGPIDFEDILKIGWITDELEREEDPDRDKDDLGEIDDGDDDDPDESDG